jgi:hypothetical protein
MEYRYELASSCSKHLKASRCSCRGERERATTPISLPLDKERGRGKTRKAECLNNIMIHRKIYYSIITKSDLQTKKISVLMDPQNSERLIRLRHEIIDWMDDASNHGLNNFFNFFLVSVNALVDLH